MPGRLAGELRRLNRWHSNLCNCFVERFPVPCPGRVLFQNDGLLGRAFFLSTASDERQPFVPFVSSSVTIGRKSCTIHVVVFPTQPFSLSRSFSSFLSQFPACTRNKKRPWKSMRLGP